MAEGDLVIAVPATNLHGESALTPAWRVRVDRRNVIEGREQGWCVIRMKNRVVLGMGISPAEEKIDPQGSSEEPDDVVKPQRAQQSDDIAGGRASIGLVLLRRINGERLAKILLMETDHGSVRSDVAVPPAADHSASASEINVISGGRGQSDHLDGLQAQHFVVRMAAEIGNPGLDDVRRVRAGPGRGRRGRRSDRW